MARIVDWNGKDLPEALRELPAGRYLLERLEEGPELTPEEEAGIREALRSLEAGEGRSFDQVREAIAGTLKQ